MTNRQEPPQEEPRASAEPLPISDFITSYQQAYPRLIALAAGVLGRREGAEDVVQQAVEIALAKQMRFDSAGRFVEWMAGAVRRCALNQRRKTGRRRTFATSSIDLAAALHATPARTLPINPSTGELQRDQQCFEDRLLSALEDLTADARCCLLLRTVGELSYAEISKLLDIPQGTAMSHVHRSRQLLRERLADSPDDAPTP